MDFLLPEIDTVTNAESGVTVPLKGLDGKPLLNANKEPVALTLVGSDSQAYRRASRAAARVRVERASQIKQGETPTDEQMDALADDDIRLLVACTRGWSGVIDLAKKPVAFSETAVAAFYKAFPVAREQADAAIVTRSLFTKASLPGS